LLSLPSSPPSVSLHCPMHGSEEQVALQKVSPTVLTIRYQLRLLRFRGACALHKEHVIQVRHLDAALAEHTEDLRTVLCGVAEHLQQPIVLGQREVEPRHAQRLIVEGVAGVGKQLGVLLAYPRHEVCEPSRVMREELLWRFSVR